MYNLRYHIASLVAVFLALALGLILGGLVVQRGTVDRQQGALVEGLRKEFKDLRTENDDLSASNELLSAHSAAMTEAWSADRLVGKTIVVLTGSGRNDGLGAAQDAIKSAGGAVVTVTMLKSDLGLDDEGLRSLVASGDAKTTELVSSVAASLAAEWSAPAQQRPVTDALVEAGAISVKGLDPGVAVAGLVDIASIGTSADPVALAIASAMSANDVVAMGAQTLSRDTGVAASADERGLAAFDTLGSPVGDYTLVALLTGAKSGYYGVGDGVEAPFPAVPEK